MASFPVIDLSAYLHKSGDWQTSCTEIAGLLQQFGMLIVRDERVDPSLNSAFLDMLEQYYEQPVEVRNEDARPDVHYQVGTTPEEVEKARNHCQRIKGLSSSEKPLTEYGNTCTHALAHTAVGVSFIQGTLLSASKAASADARHDGPVLALAWMMGSEIICLVTDRPPMCTHVCAGCVVLRVQMPSREGPQVSFLLAHRACAREQQAPRPQHAAGGAQGVPPVGGHHEQLGRDHSESDILHIHELHLLCLLFALPVMTPLGHLLRASVHP